jgi:hypothetical protein
VPPAVRCARAPAGGHGGHTRRGLRALLPVRSRAIPAVVRLSPDCRPRSSRGPRNPSDLGTLPRRCDSVGRRPGNRTSAECAGSTGTGSFCSPCVPPSARVGAPAADGGARGEGSSRDSSPTPVSVSPCRGALEPGSDHWTVAPALRACNAMDVTSGGVPPGLHRGGQLDMHRGVEPVDSNRSQSPSVTTRAYGGL